MLPETFQKRIDASIDTAMEIVRFFQNHASGIAPVMDKLRELELALIDIKAHVAGLVTGIIAVENYYLDECDQLRKRVEELEQQIQGEKRIDELEAAEMECNHD